MVSPVASRTPLARPLATMISFTSESIITPPPAAVTMRASACGRLAAPPTGRVNSITLEKIAGNTIPAPGTLSVVMTCM